MVGVKAKVMSTEAKTSALSLGEQEVGGPSPAGFLAQKLQVRP